MLALLVMAVTGAVAQTPSGLYLEVDGTSATLKYDAAFSTASGKPYYGKAKSGNMAWYSFSGYSNIATVTVDASCKDFNGTSLNGLFADWTALTTINDLGNLNTANVTNMSYMFYYCSALTTLDLSSFNTANVTNMYSMFGGCSNLTTLDLSSFNTANVTNMTYMFYNCQNLATIYVGDGWSTDKVSTSDYIFTGCWKLPNWDGTTTATKAHTGEGGYLTYKAPAIAVTPTANANEWTFKMPAYDVELQIEYKTPSQLLLTFGGKDIPAEGLTAYVGLNDEFAAGLDITVEGLAGATGFTLTSDNTQVIAFGDENKTTGTLQDIRLRAEGTANLTVTFAGTDDYSTATATVKVTVQVKKYDITVNDGTANPNWEVIPNPAESGTKVTATYKGTKRVKSVKAVIVPDAPAGPTTYDKLEDGMILKPGDIINITSDIDYDINNGFYITKDNSPCTIMRADIAGDDDDPIVTEADNGAYYVVKRNNSYYMFKYSEDRLPVTDKSDGLLVTLVSDLSATYKKFTFTVHEPK